MNVKLAAQVTLLKKILIIFTTYTYNYILCYIIFIFENSLETEHFSNLFNNIFDALNRKFPAEGIRQNSEDFKEFIFINISQ